MKLSKRASFEDIRNLGKNIYDLSEQLNNALLKINNKELIDFFNPIRYYIIKFYIFLERKDISKVLTSNLNYKKAENTDTLMLLGKLINSLERFQTNIQRYYINEFGGYNPGPSILEQKASNIEEHLSDFSELFNEFLLNEYNNSTEEQKKELENKHELVDRELSNEYGDILVDRFPFVTDDETKTANRKTLSKWAEELDEDIVEIPPMSRKEKWETFERLRNRLETFNISKKQFDAALKIIEERLFGTIHNHK